MEKWDAGIGVLGLGAKKKAVRKLYCVANFALFFSNTANAAAKMLGKKSQQSRTANLITLGEVPLVCELLDNQQQMIHI